jgi:hypothetical protein
MWWSAALVVVVVMLLPGVGGRAHATEDAMELGEARTRLVESTREYRLTLERLLVIQEAAAARAGREAGMRRTLLHQGIISRREAEESERAAAAAGRRLGETQQRLAETDAALAETLAAIELAHLPPAAESVSTPLAVGGSGAVDVTAPIVARLEQFFLVRFTRPLPVSARGQTAVHDRLRLDHHHAVDVSVHPDTEEGRALIEYLRLHRIPFLAFRGFIAGASTGAHVHIGPASSRVIPAGTVGR